jgi:hypothetical protein
VFRAAGVSASESEWFTQVCPTFARRIPNGFLNRRVLRQGGFAQAGIALARFLRE